MTIDTELPNVQNVNLPSLGVRLVDSGRLTDNESRISHDFQRLVLQQRVLGQIRPDTELCGAGSGAVEYRDGLYREALAVDPSTTWDEFIDAADGAKRDDSDCDPRCKVKTFAVLTLGGATEVLGSFTLYDAKILSVEGRTTNLSAMAMPGCEAAPGLSLRETWSGIMLWMLENEMRFQGADRLQVVEWRFPTRASHQWKLAPGETAHEGDDVGVCDRVVADLAASHDLLTQDGVPVSVQRSAGGGLLAEVRKR